MIYSIFEIDPGPLKSYRIIPQYQERWAPDSTNLSRH